MVTIEIYSKQATIQDYVWSCEEPTIADFLNATTDLNGPSGSDPYPDLTAALRAIKEAGSGRVISFLRPVYDPEMIY